MLQHSLPLLELRSQAEGIVTGLAASFGGLDSYGDSIAPGAFTASLNSHALRKTQPAMLWAHASESPIGRWETMAESSRGLAVSGRLNLKTQGGSTAYEHLRAGDVGGLSIGYDVAANGHEMQPGGVRLLKAINLHEVSVVALPADLNARVQSVKQLADIDPPANVRDFQAALQRMGFSRREAARISQKGYGALEPGSDLIDDDIPPAELQAVAGALLAFQRALKGTAS